MSPRTAGLLMAVVILLLGFNWPILKLGLRGADPLWFATIRILLAALAYAVLLVAQRRLALPNRQDMPVLLGVGVFQMGIMIGLMTFGLKHVDAGRSVILVYTTSLWVLPGAVLFLGERASRWQIAGLLVGLAGVVILFNPLNFAWHDRMALIGNACLLLCALSWAVALLMVRGHRWRLDPLQLLPWQSLVGAAILLPFAVWQEGWSPHLPWSAGFVLVLAYNVVPAGAFALWGIMAAGRVLPAITLSIGQLATPVVGVASAAVMLGERPSPEKLAGLACILTGVALATFAGRRAARAARLASASAE
jgi:drug/metabolite transporter (DMT)-like permease